MKPQVIHCQMQDGSATHRAFNSSRDWEDALRDEQVSMRWTHFKDSCPGKGMPLQHAPKSPSIKLPPLVLVDCMNLAFRSYHAFSQLSTEDGVPTGTYYGFLREVLALSKTVSDRLLFCWDGGVPGDRYRPGWHKQLLPSYKDNRTPNIAKAIIRQQLPMLSECVRRLGYAQAGIPGLEADDLIGILSVAIPGKVFMHSNDKDLYQLLESDRVLALKPKKGTTTYRKVSAAMVEKEFGISIADWSIYLALGGDTADNIKPIPGWGPKTAAKLVQQKAEQGISLAQALENALKNPQLEDLQAVRTACLVTTIPKSLQDPKIRSYVQHIDPTIRFYPGRIFADEAERQKRMKDFINFCSEFELLDFLTKRREFFHAATTSDTAANS